MLPGCHDNLLIYMYYFSCELCMSNTYLMSLGTVYGRRIINLFSADALRQFSAVFFLIVMRVFNMNKFCFRRKTKFF